MSRLIGRLAVQRPSRRIAMRGRAGIAVATATLALVLVSCGSTNTETTTISAPTSVPTYNGPGWIVSFSGFESLAAQPAARAIFDNPRTFVIAKSQQIGELAGWKSKTVVDFKSYATMQQAFADGGIPAGVTAVMYDNEHWSYTPMNEQQDPARYEQLAAALIHSHGLEYLATPAADLAAFLANGGTGSEFESYLSLDFAGQAAKYADILNIQAQGEEGDTSAYASFLMSAIRQARAANPKIVIYAGISTARSSDPNAMFNAVQATEGDVTGYWLNVVASQGAGAVTLAQNFVNSIAAKLHAT